MSRPPCRRYTRTRCYALALVVMVAGAGLLLAAACGDAGDQRLTGLSLGQSATLLKMIYIPQSWDAKPGTAPSPSGRKKATIVSVKISVGAPTGSDPLSDAAWAVVIGSDGQEYPGRLKLANEAALTSLEPGKSGVARWVFTLPKAVEPAKLQLRATHMPDAAGEAIAPSVSAEWILD